MNNQKEIAVGTILETLKVISTTLPDGEYLGTLNNQGAEIIYKNEKYYLKIHQICGCGNKEYTIIIKDGIVEIKL